MTSTDITGIASNLGAIQQVQSSWDLPPIPQQAQFDLASQGGTTPSQLSSFLTGLHQDVQKAINPLVPTPVTSAPQQGQIVYSPNSTTPGGGVDLNALLNPTPSASSLSAPAPQVTPVYPTVHSPDATDKFRSIMAGVQGDPAPTVPDSFAVQQIKTQAKQMGLLPADYPVDGTWNGDMNTVYNQMQTLQFQRRSQGNKPGSFSIGSLINKANEWLSPTFLLKTATKMKFLPNFGDVENEFANWPDKWAKFNKTHSVHDFFDALTGPIDDVVVPLFNTAMLLSGAGEVYTFARMGEMAPEAMEAASWADKAKALLIPGRYDAAMAAADRASFAEPGLLASHLGALGDQMTAWKSLEGVQDAKKIMQVGMRLGQTGLLETNLFPHAGYAKPIVELRKHRSENPQTYMLGDLFVDPLFHPSSIWPEGFIKGPLTAPNDYFKAKFGQIGKGARITDEVAKGMLDSLQRVDPESAATFKQTLDTQGPSAALIEYHGGGEAGAQKAGFRTTWITLATAIDSEAVKAATLAQPDKSLDPANWWQTFYKLRPKNIAELKAWEPNNLDDYLDYVKNTLGTKAYGKVLAKAADPAQRQGLMDEFNTVASAHNANRAGKAALLLDQITPGMVQAHMARMFDNPNDWDNFIASTSDLQSWVAQGAKPEAGTITKTVTKTNPEWERALSLKTRLLSDPGTLDQPLMQQELDAELARLKGVPQTITENTQQPNELRYAQVKSANGSNLAVRPKGEGLDLSKYIAPGLREEPTSVSWDGNFNPLVRGLDPSQTGWTIMRADSATKQDAIRLINETKGLEAKRDAALWLDQNRGHAGMIYTTLQKAAQEAGQTDELGQPLIGELDARTAMQKVEDAYGAGFTKNVKAGTQMVQEMGRNGTSIDDVVGTTAQDLIDHGNKSVWGDKFGIAAHLDPGSKQRALIKLQNWMASEVDGAPQNLVDSLAARGYKLAHGTGAFLMPGDLSGLVSPFQEVTKQQMRQMTLGTFIWGAGDDSENVNKVIGDLRARRFRDSLVERLSRLQDQGALGTNLPISLKGDSPDIDNMLSLLKGEKMAQQDRAAAGLENAHGWLNKLAERIHAAGAPQRVQDLVRADVGAVLSPIYGDNVATQAYKALKDSFFLGDDSFKYRGLAGVEDYLRSNSLPVSALKLLSQTSSGARIIDGANPEFRASSRLLSAALGAGVGYEAADKTGNNGRLGAIAGAAAGALAGPQAAKNALNLVQDSNWDTYTRLPDTMTRISQIFRFTLSPMFDVERMVKGSLLSGTAELPEGTTLPFKIGPQSFIKQYGEAAWNDVQSKYAAVAHGATDAADIENASEAQRIFQQEGILGFSPVHQRQAAFGHLVQQGVDPQQAYNIAGKIFSYGNRSALEQSINFLFFPFSFEKKLYSSMATFLSSDLGRSLAIHDGIRAYSALSDKYDLSQKLAEHVPVLKDIEKLNAFAYGANFGELGGINAPWIHAFLPVATTGNFNATKLVKRLVPAYRDISYLLGDLQQQGHVVFGANHLTTDAEAQKGWDALKAWKQQADIVAKQRGYPSWAQSSRDAGMKDVADKYKIYKAQLYNKYPAFEVSLADVIARQQDNAIEVQRRTLDPKTPADHMLAEFAQQEEAVKATAKTNGFDMTNAPEDVPEQYFQTMRDTALALGPAFLSTYNHFYRKVYGPIQETLP